MSDQNKTPSINTPVEVKAELLEHLKSELSTAQANMEKNEREGFPDAAASWLLSVAKWQRMINYVEKAS